MSKLAPHDAQVRLRAIDPRRSFIVQAPAGSGKTELLTDRILKLLATVRRPEEIVAITFTRKAAAEMHERVLHKLQKGLLENPPEATHEHASWELARAALKQDREMGWQLLQHPARLTIRTIDAFCASLVRAMPWLSAMGGVPAIVDDPREHYLAAARMTIALADDNEYAFVTDLLKHLDLDIQVATNALADMLSKRDQWMPLLEESRDRDALEENLQSAIQQELSSLVKAMPVAWAEQLAEGVRLAADALNQSSPGHAVVELLDWDGEPIEAELENLPQWKGLSELLLTATGTLRKTMTVNNGCPPKSRQKEILMAWLASHASDQTPEWAIRLHGILKTPEPVFTDEQWEILRAQMLCLRVAAAQLLTRFAEVGEVDFIEIAQRAALALGNAEFPTELLLKLDQNIQHLLIDEFQDTSQSQIDLLEKITSGWQADDGRTLFLVGDPMQSIYRFRKADVALFLKVRDEGLGAIKLDYLQLTDNFRSQAGVVDWVNQVFSQLLPRKDEPSAGAISYAPSRAFHEESIRPAVCFHPVFPQSGARAGMAVVKLVSEALERYPEADHPVAILVRARSHLKDVTQMLAEANIACRAVELVPLHQRPFVVDLVQIVRALTHPGDRAAWVSVLRSPYCGLRLTTLHQLVAAQPNMAVPALLTELLHAPQTQNSIDVKSAFVPEELERLMAIAPALLATLNEDDALPLAARLERLWRRLGGPSLAKGPADLQDAERLFQLIEKLAPYGGLDLDLLESRLEKLFASPDASQRAVEVMTMHKAKGLQFESVILFGLHHGPAPDKSPLVRIEQVEDKVLFGPIKPRASDDKDPISDYLGRREKSRASFEVDRLLYVAATRAKESLHLVAEVFLDKKKGGLASPSAGSLLQRLWTHLALPVVSAELSFDEPDLIAQPFFKGPRLCRRLEIPVPFAGAGLKDRSGVFKTDTANTPNAAFAWRASTTYERDVGTLIHAWLAHIGEQGLADWPVEKVRTQLRLIQRQLTQAGVPEESARAGAVEVSDTLVAMLTHEKGRWLLDHPGSYREWALLDTNGKVSVLDLALDDETGWLVVDYKTGRPQPEESKEDFAGRMLARYAPQLQRYCDQVHALDGRPAHAALYFPNDDLWLPMIPAEVSKPC